MRVLMRPEEKTAFTAAWRAAKATAPSKPHPNGPTRTPWTYLAHPLAAGVDVVTDTMTHSMSGAIESVGQLGKGF